MVKYSYGETMKLTKSKERVSKHGEVFTPKHIVDSMIALISDDVWGDKSQITLEPTCGNGNFIVEIVNKKVSCGLNLYEALNTTFGMDIMQDNIQECHDRLIKICEKELKDSGVQGVRFKKAMIIYICLMLNNIFVVKDSLQYMKDGHWDKKQFFERDPSVPRKKSFIIEEGEEGFVLNNNNKEIIIKKATEMYTRKFENVE